MRQVADPILSERYGATVGEEEFQHKRGVIDPPLRTREEMAYHRLFQQHLTGMDPAGVVGRFPEA